MLSTEFGGIKLECCIYNASGPRTGSVEALEKIAQSGSGAILAKSATLIKQDGNPLPRFVNKIKLNNYCDGSLNSEGLPNAGIDYYISEDVKEKLGEYSKPYIVSLSGLSLSDNLEMIDRAYNAPNGIAGVELNLACPNIPGKPVVSNDFDQMNSVLKAITEHPKHGVIPLGIKLGPYFDKPFFEQAAQVIAKYPINYVVTTNTIGNALFIDAENECEAIAANRGMGGLGGGFVKHTALANVRTLRELLDGQDRQDIDIVGVGGVCSGRDAFELILCGARAVQVGTCHWTEGAGCFQRIAEELRELMQRKGYTSIEDFRGKLKAYVPPQRSGSGSAGAGAGGGEGGGGQRKKTGGEVGAGRSIHFSSRYSQQSDREGEVEVEKGGINVGELAMKLCYALIGAAVAMALARVRAALGM